MINYYQRTITDHKLKLLKDFQVGSLVYVTNPNEQEIELLSKKFSLDSSIIVDALDPYESPRMEIKKSVAYIFVRVPEQKIVNKAITTYPVMFVIGKNFLIIVSRENPEFLINMINKRKKYFTTQRTKLFLEFFLEIEGIYNDFLNKINKKINYLSLNVGNIKDRDIVEFIQYEIVLNEFVSALFPVRHVLSSIISGKLLNLYQDDRDLIDDIQLNNEQLIERSKSNLTNIINIRQAHEVISTNRLNRIMRVLTVSTVILALPTMITSFYGMNVSLPLGANPNAFWGILGVILLFIAIFLVLFKSKKII